jgi:drug/metabolite transporter (DMT)-like permease
MTAVLLGIAAALSWGFADFAARFTGRAVGPTLATLAMLSISAAAITLYLGWQGVAVDWRWPSLLLPAVSGFGIAAATLLLYYGLATGPVTIVSPIAGSYPALVVGFEVLTGFRPSLAQWCAMAVTLIGVFVVARAGGHFSESGRFTSAALRQATIAAAAACFMFALGVVAGQQAVPDQGGLGTLWLSRIVSVLVVAGVVAARRERPAVPVRWLPLLAAQGLLDGAAYLAIFAGSAGDGAAIVAVVSSAFGVVTTLLGRLFLDERVTPVQWLGIALVFGGVAVLSGAAGSP